MKWKKITKLFSVDVLNHYLYSHAANPLPIKIDENLYRIYFCSRDKKNRSSVSYVDLDLYNFKIKKVNTYPLLTYGDKSSFFSHGISIGDFYKINDIIYILFMGWQIRNNDHWRGDIGRIKLSNIDKMIVDPSNKFIKSDNEDPISLSYPCVIFDNNIYKMWYGSTIKWDAGNKEMIHVIKYATSDDGECWIKHGIAIPYEIGIAQAFSRPIVIKDNKCYHMWYSYRSGKGTKYRIGYSKSNNSTNWIRNHEDVGIDVSDTGWDSEMICYPYVFDHNGQRFMLYNGNGFGKTGFGISILEQD